MRPALIKLMLFASSMALMLCLPRGSAARETAIEVLSRTASATWARTPLREALDGLAERYAVSIFLDRRIDPGTQISGSFPESSAQDLLEAMGQRQKLGVAAIGSVVYVGPPEAARRMRTLNRLRASETSRLNGPLRRRLLAEATLTWPNLTTPRELVEQVCRKVGISLENADRIPHDLWGSNEFSELPPVSQLTLLLAGFDLTFEFARQGEIRLRPIRQDELWERTYRLPHGHPEVVNRMRRSFPNALLMTERNRLFVRGLVEEHEAIAEWLQNSETIARPATRPVVPQETAGNQSPVVYTLRVVRRPLKEILDEIEKSTPYRIAYDEASLKAAGVELNRLVSFEVIGVDIDGLMDAILEPARLSFRRDDAAIEVFASP